MKSNYELHNVDCLELVTEPVSLVYLDPPYSCESEDVWSSSLSDLDEKYRLLLIPLLLRIELCIELRRDIFSNN